MTQEQPSRPIVNMEITNDVWMWAALAAILLAGEVITTSFVLIFFAVSAFITAILTAVMPLEHAVQIIIFGALGLVGLFAGRKWIRTRLASKAPPVFELDSDARFTIDRDLAPGAEGAVHYQGAPWTAKNDGHEAIRTGDEVKVIRTSGIKLLVQKANK